MIIWFRHLPQISMDLKDWTPFIENNWFRKHYMKFVYLFQVTIFLMSRFFDVWFIPIDTFVLILIFIVVFIIHESLHILVINKKGDISLTFRGTFFCSYIIEYIIFHMVYLSSRNAISFFPPGNNLCKILSSLV